MANTFTCLHYHVVFSTKHREPWLRPEFHERLWAYLGGIARQHDLTPLLVGGMDDHIHILAANPSPVRDWHATNLTWLSKCPIMGQ